MNKKTDFTALGYILVLFLLIVLALNTYAIINLVKSDNSLDNDYCYNKCLNENLSVVGYTGSGIDIKCVCLDEENKRLVINNIFEGLKNETQ